MGYLFLGVLVLAVLLFMALVGQISQNKSLISQLTEPSDNKAKSIKSAKSRFSPESLDEDESELSYREITPEDEFAIDRRNRSSQNKARPTSRPYQKNNATSVSEFSKDTFKEAPFESSPASFSDVAFTETMMDSPSSKFDL